VQQTLGGSRIVGGQDDQARHPLLQGEYVVGGFAEVAPVADTGKLASFQQVGSVGEVTDQQER
jgi:hypothetical protein